MGSPEKNKSPENPSPNFKNRNWLQAFQHASEGIQFAWKNERNLRIDTVFTVLTLALCWLLDLNRNEWMIMIACIGAVLVAELLNSLFEATVDLIVGNHYNRQAKHIKDMAAGTVVLVCIVILIIGTLVLWPHLRQLIGG